ncbi:MAG: DUF4405 domain-containing protein [Lachnospiraceae bacterium]|nr:DUF4405 domain-containing protein [Lachnospiraceae bacterium]
MKAKQTIKMVIDIGMTILLFVLMAFHYVGLQWHEITGAAMLVLFILHHILNGNWYRALGKGKYRSGRVLLTVVDVVLLVNMVLLMFSGIAMSRYVFRFLDLPVSKAWARGMHMTASYAGFLLMGFHIGLHYGMIVGMVKKAFSTAGAHCDRKRQTVSTWIVRGMAVFIAGYGAHALYTRKFFDYISQKVMFAFFDYDEPIIYFVLDYVAIMGLMIFISYYFQKFLQRRILPVSDGNQKRE